MPRLIVPQFTKFPAEGQLIGRLLAGYGNLESALSNCVAMGVGNVDMVIKAMFRPRGETQRIDIADAIGRGPYRNLGFENEFSEAIADMRYCLKIRNQYAHCQWHDDLTGNLCFVDMQEIATGHAVIADFRNLTFHYVTTPLLEEQEAYFVYAGDCFLFLNMDGRRKRGEFPSHAVPKPKKVPRPPLWLP